MKHLMILIIIFSSISINAQNRLFERLGDNLGRTQILDIGNGESHWVMEQRYSFDSTHVHFMHCDADMNLSNLGAFRTSAPLGWMNDAALVNDGVVIGGASLGFYTRPYILRMNTSGDVSWSKMFTDLEDGNTQILNAYTKGDRLDLFTWSDNTRDHYYLINGFIDGSFPTALKIDAPEGTEIRTDEIASVSNDREYLVICQADTNNTFSRFLYVMHIDSSGVISAQMHDHVQFMGSNSESAFGLIPTADGNWLYACSYFVSGGGFIGRLIKMEIDGTVIWSKEYWLNGEQLRTGVCHETEDNGFLFSASNGFDHFFVKIDPDGEVQWSQIYQQTVSQNVPTGWFFENDQGQLYSWNSNAITEMDENINVCDMVPHEGITAQDAPFITQAVTTNSTTIVPVVEEFIYHSRSGDYSLELDCQSTHLEESNDLTFGIYPNPFSDFVQIDIPRLSSTVEVRVISITGELMLSRRIMGIDRIEISLEKLSAGLYMIELYGLGQSSRKRIVKL
ncbi:MAG: T9SS type A sorting domain-containing protein [Flavobacteriales bacterium]|nr:T9SS type A sorting domain-containing protein [Flavobacteriales bacterium]